MLESHEASCMPIKAGAKLTRVACIAGWAASASVCSCAHLCSIVQELFEHPQVANRFGELAGLVWSSTLLQHQVTNNLIASTIECTFGTAASEPRSERAVLNLAAQGSRGAESTLLRVDQWDMSSVLCAAAA
jgi:hypothetical protein